jgi:Flp pilus assembly protein TadG
MKALLNRAHDERGATLVEFALVVPVVLLLVLACVDFARAANAYLVITNASREAARYASAHPGQVSKAQLRSYLADRVAPLDLAAIGINDPVYAPPPISDTRWSSSSPAPWSVTVEVSYTWDNATWLIGSFFTAASGSPRFDVSSTMETVQ